MEDFAIGAGVLPFTWYAPKGEFLPSDGGLEVMPDITQWSTNDLVVARNAMELLSPHFTSEVVEVFALAGNAKNYVFLNPVRRIGNEVVDMEHTEFLYLDDGTWDRLERLVLKNQRY